MSHEHSEFGPVVTYTVPLRPSDVLRRMHFDAFFQSYVGSPFAVRTLDGWSWSSSAYHPPKFVATFRTTQLLDTVISNATETTLGHIFLDGNLDIEGDIFAVLSVAQFTMRHSEGLNGNLIQAISRFCVEIHRRLKPSTKNPGAPNWHCCPCPVDLPVRFFESWLGPLLGHSCAAIESPDQEFQTAQIAGLDRTCESLNLERGDRLLDVGCGWGTLLLHSAARFGIEAQGIAASGVQAEIADTRIDDRGLHSHCRVDCRDLRTAPLPPEHFDKIADIGVFEQVKSADLGEYLDSMRQMLSPGGLLLLHRITRSRSSSAATICSLEPDLVFDSLGREIDVAESTGLHLVKLESLQSEYELTLRVWIDRLRRNWTTQAESSFDRAQRAWLLYLIETAAYLQMGDLQVHRVILRRAKPLRKLT